MALPGGCDTACPPPPPRAVCARCRRSAHTKVICLFAPGAQVGDQPVGEAWGGWVCPHIIGGIPPSTVDAEFPMARSPLPAGGAEFMSIAGV